MSDAAPAIRLSVVATLYRSTGHLAEFHARIVRELEALTPDYELVLVNDGCPDGSLELALELRERNPRVTVIDLSRNFGHHRAIMTGLAAARGDLVFLIDCDLEEPPEVLGQFHAVLLEKPFVDVVFGVQRARRGGWVERTTGAWFYRLFNLLSPMRVQPNQVIARLMRRRYVEALLRFEEREVFFAGIATAAGFVQLPLEVEKLASSPTTYSLGRKFDQLVNSITSFSSRPLYLLFYGGALVMLGAAGYITYALVNALVIGSLEGWPSLIISIWTLGGLNLMGLGLLGICLSKVFSEVKQRPYSIVKQRYPARIGLTPADDVAPDADARSLPVARERA